MTERQILDSTYFDTVTIYRRENYLDPATGQTRQRDKIIAEALRCALSKNQGHSHGTDGSVGQIRGEYVLFANPGAPIADGDFLAITTGTGMTVKGRAGTPFVYPSHLEVPVSVEKRP